MLDLFHWKGNFRDFHLGLDLWGFHLNKCVFITLRIVLSPYMLQPLSRVVTTCTEESSDYAQRIIPPTCQMWFWWSVQVLIQSPTHSWGNLCSNQANQETKSLHLGLKSGLHTGLEEDRPREGREGRYRGYKRDDQSSFVSRPLKSGLTWGEVRIQVCVCGSETWHLTDLGGFRKIARNATS